MRVCVGSNTSLFVIKSALLRTACTARMSVWGRERGRERGAPVEGSRKVNSVFRQSVVFYGDACVQDNDVRLSLICVNTTFSASFSSS